MTVSSAQSQAGVPGGTGTYSVVGALRVTVESDRASYAKNGTVKLTARVTADGQPIAGATVAFTITKPNGSRVTGSATTAADGTARYQTRLKVKDPVGTYRADATAAVGALSASGQTTFVVQ